MTSTILQKEATDTSEEHRGEKVIAFKFEKDDPIILQAKSIKK
ncbi:MAG: hypothetical protein PWR20_1398 [Bacteroidales bacterium]|jgi:hypothetical protein|nr:hypothetical protein [Bacteroidales bacterium]